MKNAVFLDSGIFIAFLNRRDAWHAHAVGCLVDRSKIGRVWATDHHLGLAGAEVLPRS